MHPSDKFVLFAVLTLSATATMLSGWMWRSSAGSRSLPGCGVESSCAAVTRSRWAKWGPVPVTSLGMLLFVAIFTAALCSLFSATGWVVLECLAFAACGAAGWFLLLQALVIRRFCAYCNLVHACGIFCAVLIFAHTRPWQTPFPAADSIVGALGVVTLVVGQVRWIPAMYAVTSNQETPKAQEPELVTGPPPVQPAERTLTGRRITLQGVEFSVDDWPVLGTPRAQHLIAWMFDFTCEECHHEHRMLRQVLSLSQGDLAVLAVPVPLHPDCNPTLQHKDPARIQSCVYARLSWALWLTDAGSYDQWDQFMCEDAQVQPFGLALRKAQSLADLSRFQIKGPDPTLDERIAAGISAHLAAKSVDTPAILMPRGLLSGHVPTAGQLLEIIRRHL